MDSYDWKLRFFLTGCGQWEGLCWLGGWETVCVRCQDWENAMDGYGESPYPCIVTGCGQRCGLYRLGRRQAVCLRRQDWENFMDCSHRRLYSLLPSGCKWVGLYRLK